MKYRLKKIIQMFRSKKAPYSQRSSCSWVFCRKVLQKHPWLSSFKVTGPRSLHLQSAANAISNSSHDHDDRNVKFTVSVVSLTNSLHPNQIHVLVLEDIEIKLVHPRINTEFIYCFTLQNMKLLYSNNVYLHQTKKTIYRAIIAIQYT